MGEVEGAGGRDRHEPCAATAALRLGVVEGQRVFVNPLGEGREIVVVARHHAIAVCPGPPSLGDGHGHRTLREVRRSPLFRLDHQHLLDGAIRDVLGELLVEALHHGAELELRRHVAQAAAIRRCPRLLADVDRDVYVVVERGQLLRDTGVVGVLGQVLLALGAGDLVDAVEHGLQRPELLQELGRGLVADPRDARDVVGGVPLQADQVRDELWRHAVALDHSVAVVDLGVGHSAGGGHDPHPVADHLVDVAIAGDDHHGDVRVAGALNEARDHVVGLPPVHLHVVEAERLGERRQVGPLLLQQVGTRGTPGLVLRVLLVPARHPGVPGDDHRRRPVLDEDLGHHRGEAIDGIGGPPIGRRDRLGQGEERTIRGLLPSIRNSSPSPAPATDSEAGFVFVAATHPS